MNTYRFLLLGLCFGFSTISHAQFFTDISSELGIDYAFQDFVSIGGGTTFFDYDADGDDDLYFTGGKQSDRLFRNNGDGSFTDVTTESGLDITANYYTTGVTTGDIDNDGYRDIFLTTFGDSDYFIPNLDNLLLRNNGDGTFQNISQQANIKGRVRSAGALFLDHDLDGYLDIYVVNYIDNSALGTDENGDPEFQHTCFENYLYHNNGDNTFTESAAPLGVNDNGCSLAATTTDFNQDLVPDLYVINDFGEFIVPNLLFSSNPSNGTFDNINASTNAGIGLYGMGVAWSDYDLDGDVDYYITNLGSNALLVNDGNGSFEDQAAAANVLNTNTPDNRLATSWGTAFMDYDNDLDEDLLVANGHIPAATFIATGTVDPNKFYQNNGDQTFTDISDAAGFNQGTRSRGLSYSDYDGDGDLDFFVSVMYGQADDPHMLFLRNNLDNDNSWLQIALVGTDCNRDAFGARVYAFAGGQMLIRELSGGGSHASQHSSTLHFGLAANSQVDSVQVAWPGGQVETFYNLDINQKHTLTQTPAEQVRLDFELDMTFDNPAPSGVFVQLTDDEGNSRKKLMHDPFGQNILSTSFLLPEGFSGHYTFLNGNCPDNNCAEDLSESPCGDPLADFQRVLTPLTADTLINICYGICPGDICRSTIDSFQVDFVLNPALLDEDLDEVFIWGLSSNGIPTQLYDDDGDGLFSTSITLPEGFSSTYIYSNGPCLDPGCAEDLSGQPCVDPNDNNYRYLPPIGQDTMLAACFSLCNLDSCLAPVDTFRVFFNLNMTYEDVNFTGVFIRGDYFGIVPLFDGNDDGIYTNFFDIPENETIYYTFSNGSNCPDGSCLEDLDGQACANPDQNNYRLLPPLTGNTTIDLCFGSCELAQCDPIVVPPDTFQLSFQVNMINEDVSPDGVFLYSAFNTEMAFTPLTDPDGDSVYELDLRVEENTDGFYWFSNGDCPNPVPNCFEQFADLYCGDNNLIQHSRLLPPVGQDTLIQTCFGECIPNLDCTPPPPALVEIQFVLDMTNEIISPDGIQLLGNFTDFEGDLLLQNDLDPNIFTTGLLLPPGEYQYRYLNGDILSGTSEDLLTDDTGECSVLLTDGERWRTLTVVADSPQVLDMVCFNSCSTCIVNSNNEVVSNGLLDFRLQPNVTRQSSQLLIETNLVSPRQLQLHTVSGQVIRTYELGRYENNYELSLADLPAGLYWLSLRVDSYRKIKRIIKI